MIDWVVEAIMRTMVVLFFIFVFVGLPLIGYAFYHDMTSPTFSLKKDSWRCTASHNESSTYFIQAGKVMVPQTTNSTVCDQWSRRN